MAIKFERELKRIKTDLKLMSEKVQDNLRDALKSLKSRDIKLSEKVVEFDKTEIDALYTEIEERCIQCIALHQPVAGDLRFISAALNVSTNLERIGDYAKDAAMVVGFIAHEKPVVEIEGIIQEMGAIGITMTKDSIDSFVNKNEESIEKVGSGEEKVDALYGKLLTTLKKEGTIHRDNYSTALNILLAGRCMERIGDHALNISRRARYVIKGGGVYL